MSPFLTRRRLEGLAMGAVVMALAMWRFGGTTADPDIWGHVKFGVDKIQSGFRLHGDAYSYLGEGTEFFDPRWAGEVVFNHEWLGEVVMGGVFLWLGSAGLVWLKAVLAASIVAVFTWWLLKEGIAPVRTALLMLINVILLTPTLGTFRPQIFTLAAMTALLVIMVAYTRRPGRYIWALPLVFALWVNLHGGFLGGVGIAGLWAVLYTVSGRRNRRFEPIAAVAVSSVALLANPTGLTHLRFLLATTGGPRPEIVEWAPLALVSLLGVGWLVMVALLAFGFYRRRHELDVCLLVPLLALTAAPFLASRHLQLFVPGVLILGAPYLAALPGSRGAEIDSPPRRGIAVVMLIVTLVAGGFSVARVASASSCLVLDPAHFAFPTRGVAAVGSAGLEGNAVVPFNWGQYIIWHLGPDVRVSGDGRRETVYSEEVHQANLDFANGEGDWDRILDMAPAHLVIQQTGTPGAQLILAEPGWELVYQDRITTVVVNQTGAQPLQGDEAIPEDGTGLCFPDDG